MNHGYKIWSGQINFKHPDKDGYQCVVIEKGVFHNINDDQTQLIIDAMNKQPTPAPGPKSQEIKVYKPVQPDFEDMFG